MQLGYIGNPRFNKSLSHGANKKQSKEKKHHPKAYTHGRDVPSNRSRGKMGRQAAVGQ